MESHGSGVTEGAQSGLVLLGVGNVALAVARRLIGRRPCIGTTRAAGRVAELVERGIEPVVAPLLTADTVALLVAGRDVVVTFPPDGVTDAAIAPACSGARAVVYISSTGVYGTTTGVVDDRTPPSPADERGRMRLEAERRWQDAGAVVLRAPGIYGPGFGLHRALLQRRYTLPGDGSGVISRIHVDDLASFVLAALERGERGGAFVVGDACTVPQREVVGWLCARLGLPLPPSAPIEKSPPTLRGNRSVDSSGARSALGVVLRYPTYREGFAACLEAEGSAS